MIRLLMIGLCSLAVLSGGEEVKAMKVLQLNDESRFPRSYEQLTELQPGQHSSWVIRRNSTNGTICSTANHTTPSFITVELWDIDQLDKLTQSPDDFADKLLALAVGEIPKVNTSVGAPIEFDPPLSFAEDGIGSNYDSKAWLLMKPYHRVSMPVIKDSDQQSDWYVSVYNIDKWVRKPLSRSVLKATCTSKEVADPCSQGVVDSTDAKQCMCDPSFADIGCTVKISALQDGEVQHLRVQQREWIFFEFEVPIAGQGFFVQLNSSSGDPILFVKRAQNPEDLHHSLPSLVDYSELSDWTNVEAMSRTQYKIIRTRRIEFRPKYVIGIYNHAGRLSDNAEVDLVLHGIQDPPSCPFNCSFHGVCSSTSYHLQCNCHPGLNIKSRCFKEVAGLGFVGDTCSSSIQKIFLKEKETGVLQPGQAVFLETVLPATEQGSFVRRSFEVRVSITSQEGQGTHPVVCAEKDTLPHTSSSTWNFLSQVNFTGNLKAKLQPESSSIDQKVTFGIFNVDFFVHSSFMYTFELYSVKHIRDLSLFASFVLGITTSMLFGLLAILLNAVIKSVCYRTPLEDDSPIPQESAQVLVESLHREMYLKDQDPAEDSPSRIPSVSSVGCGCAICLMEYAEGDTLVVLPCNHRFHENCVVQWLERNQTCPICRETISERQQTTEIELPEIQNSDND